RFFVHDFHANGSSEVILRGLLDRWRCRVNWGFDPAFLGHRRNGSVTSQLPARKGSHDILVGAVISLRFFADCQLGGSDMSPQANGKSSLASANGKATVATSRRSFIAGWKLCAGVALGLCLAGRSSSAATVCKTAVGCSCFLLGTRIKTTDGEIKIEELRID